MAVSLQALDRLTDTQLVTLAKHQLPHATGAYEALMLRHESVLTGLCRNLCPGPEQAEDVYQEVLLRIFHHLPGFRGDSAFRTWAYRIAYNQCMDLLRRQRDDQSFDPDLHEEGREDAYALSGDRFERMIAALNPQERTVVTLRLVSELEFQDIADITGDKLSALKMRYQRALEKLRRQSEETGYP